MASSAQAKEFIKRIAPIIQKEAKARGYKVCSPIIAQACIESAFDGSLLAYKYHNYFGMKCGSSWKGRSVNLKTKEEYTVGKLTTIRDNFRAYQTMEDGVKGYFDFINTKRYANLKTADTPELYLIRIKNDGYATSSRYVQTNMDCIRKYNLFEWDIPFTEGLKSLEEIAKEVIDGKWGNGTERRQRLRAAGYNPSIVQLKVNELLAK
jgi:flagellum-specific peptidoglycan hydrolase FlgJ